MPQVTSFIIQFANEISSKEIPQFRGAVIASLNQKDILFHNHQNDKLRYSYPLIQYKRIHRKATIVCVGEGTKSIHELFVSNSFLFQIGNKEEKMLIESAKTNVTDMSLLDTPKSYRIFNWLPLNSENYRQYQTIENFSEKATFLEAKLVGNLLSFLKGVGIIIEEDLKVSITNLTAQRIATYKNVKLMAFDIEFKTNLNIPQYIGIGKNASVGFGIVTRKTN